MQPSVCCFLSPLSLSFFFFYSSYSFPFIILLYISFIPIFLALTALAHVDMVVGVHGLLGAELPAEDFNGAIGNDL